MMVQACIAMQLALLDNCFVLAETVLHCLCIFIS